MTQARHTIQLEGSHTARMGETEYVSPHRPTTRNAHDPVPVLVRRLIAEGTIARDDLIEVRRGDTLCFNPRLAHRWADIDVVDHDSSGLKTHKAYIGPDAPGSDRLRALTLGGGLHSTGVQGVSEGNDTSDHSTGSDSGPPPAGIIHIGNSGDVIASANTISASLKPTHLVEEFA